MKPEAQPLRGEAAYRAQRAEIAKRNAAACEAGARARAVKTAEELKSEAVRDRREALTRPTQPGR